MSQKTEHTNPPLSPAWLAAGSLLFVVSLATPLFVLNYLPGIDALGKAKGEVASAESEALAEQAGERTEYPEIVLVRNEFKTIDALGALARLIEKQGAEAQPARASAVRRMMLDAVSVDLESSASVDLLDHLRVPIQDCDAAEHATEAWLIDDGPKIMDALWALSSELLDARSQPVAGPTARSFATTHEGMRIEHCTDLSRISAVEILPMLPAEPAHVLNVAELGEPAEDAKISGVMQQDFSQDAAVPRARSVATGPALAEIPSVSVLAGQMAEVASPLASEMTAPVAAIASDPSDKLLKPAIARPEPQGVAASLARLSSETLVLEQKPHSLRQNVVGSVNEPVVDSPSALLALNGDAFGVTTDVALAKPGKPDTSVSLASVAALPEDHAVAPVNSEALVVHAGSAAAETDLKLTRKARWRTQLRLALIGHDPKGIDGIFGAGTRGAIASLQTSESLPSTGYLDAATLAVLKQKSGRRYANWLQKRAKRRAEEAAQKLAAASAPQQVRTAPAARRAPGCARDQKGIIISNQSFNCDLSVLREGLGSLFGLSS